MALAYVEGGFDCFCEHLSPSEELAQFNHDCRQIEELTQAIDDLETKLELYDRFDDISESGLSDAQSKEYCDVKLLLCDLKYKRARLEMKTSGWEIHMLKRG